MCITQVRIQQYYICISTYKIHMCNRHELCMYLETCNTCVAYSHVLHLWNMCIRGMVHINYRFIIYMLISWFWAPLPVFIDSGIIWIIITVFCFIHCDITYLLGYNFFLGFLVRFKMFCCCFFHLFTPRFMNTNYLFGLIQLHIWFLFSLMTI